MEFLNGRQPHLNKNGSLPHLFGKWKRTFIVLIEDRLILFLYMEDVLKFFIWKETSHFFLIGRQPQIIH